MYDTIKKTAHIYLLLSNFCAIQTSMDITHNPDTSCAFNYITTQNLKGQKVEYNLNANENREFYNKEEQLVHANMEVQETTLIQNDHQSIKNNKNCEEFDRDKHIKENLIPTCTEKMGVDTINTNMIDKNIDTSNGCMEVYTNINNEDKDKNNFSHTIIKEIIDILEIDQNLNNIITFFENNKGKINYEQIVNVLNQGYDKFFKNIEIKIAKYEAELNILAEDAASTEISIKIKRKIKKTKLKYLEAKVNCINFFQHNPVIINFINLEIPSDFSKNFTILYNRFKSLKTKMCISDNIQNKHEIISKIDSIVEQLVNLEKSYNNYFNDNFLKLKEDLIKLTEIDQENGRMFVDGFNDSRYNDVEIFLAKSYLIDCLNAISNIFQNKRIEYQISNFKNDIKNILKPEDKKNRHDEIVNAILLSI